MFFAPKKVSLMGLQDVDSFFKQYFITSQSPKLKGKLCDMSWPFRTISCLLSTVTDSVKNTTIWYKWGALGKAYIQIQQSCQGWWHKRKSTSSSTILLPSKQTHAFFTMTMHQLPTQSDTDNGVHFCTALFQMNIQYVRLCVIPLTASSIHVQGLAFSRTFSLTTIHLTDWKTCCFLMHSHFLCIVRSEIKSILPVQWFKFVCWQKNILRI